MEPLNTVYYIEVACGRFFWFANNLYFKGGNCILLWDKETSRFNTTDHYINDLDECCLVADINFFDVCTDWVNKVEFRDIPIGGAFTDGQSREYFIKTSQYQATAFIDVDEDLGCYADTSEFEECKLVFQTDISTLSTLEKPKQ